MAEKQENQVIDESGNNTVYFYTNGKLVIGNEETLKKQISKMKHKCGNCANCRGSHCAKVHDIEKKLITEYPFITEGYQGLNSRHQVETFIVNECANFEHDNVKKREEENKKATKEALLMEKARLEEQNKSYHDRVCGQETEKITANYARSRRKKR